MINSALSATLIVKCYSCPKPEGETTCTFYGRTGTWRADEDIGNKTYHVCVIPGLRAPSIESPDAFFSDVEIQNFSAQTRKELSVSIDRFGGYGRLAAEALSSGFVPRRIRNPDGSFTAPDFGATSLESEPQVGLGALFGVTDWLALDLGFSYGTGTASRQASSSDGRSADREEIDYRLLAGHVNARVYPFRFDRVEPYLSAGVRGLSIQPTSGVYSFGEGGSKAEIRGNRFESTSAADLTTGAGIDVRLTDRFGLALSADHGFQTGWRAGVSLSYAIPSRASKPFPLPPSDPSVPAPENAMNPFDSYGKLHNQMLDFVARELPALENRGVVLPADVVNFLAREACADVQRGGASFPGCEGEMSRRIFSVGSASDSPLEDLYVRAGYSPQQRRDVEEIGAALSLPAEAAIARIKEVEQGILRRAGIGTGGVNTAPGIIYGDPSHPLPACPSGWPPPCDFWCPSRLGDCVPLPPVERLNRPTGLAWNDRSILMASSAARFSLAYWHKQANDPESPWNRGSSAAQAPRYDEDKLAWADFTGMLWGAGEGLVFGGIGGSLVGSVSGMIFSSIREGGSQLGWW